MVRSVTDGNVPRMLPTAAAISGLGVISTQGIAALLGISRHALHMRILRGSPSVPVPDRQLEGCLVWFATQDLADLLNVTGERLLEVAEFEYVAV